ncbi:MAG TPA: hypothetical protein VGJ58_11565 [Gaiellaceae bacterium]|jgi:hypothetical protein
MNREPVHPKARRAVLFVAIVSALIAAAAVFPATASADGVNCGPNGNPYCTWAYTPVRFPVPPENGNSPYVSYGGLGNYDGLTQQVCITIRLLISDSSGGNNHIVAEKSYCHVYTGPGGLTGTSTNVWDSVYRCCYYLFWYHTWAHSWQVWADGHAHNDRYVASERVLR